MQEAVRNRPFVSVIVPCYNGGTLVLETLQSILSQEDVSFEIIFVDDGSTDNTKSTVLSLNEKRLQYICQDNHGVSEARNNGLQHARGTYIVFFDADDKMEKGFLKSRVHYLEENKNCDFVCGKVQKFNNNGLIQGYFRGTSSDIIKEILLYDPEVTSCPSNYLFRASFLQQYHLTFNKFLSSTADKYFLIQCAQFGKCCFVETTGRLFYRILAGSMSHTLTKKLVDDNEQYYLQLLQNNLVPALIRKKALFMGYFILFRSFWKISEKPRALRYATKSFLISPLLFMRRSFA